MADNNIATGAKVSPVARGSKKGWATVTGQIPTDVAERFRAILFVKNLRQTDAVAEAVALYVEREAA